MKWTKLYYHRAFDEPNSQIEFLIRKLNQEYGESLDDASRRAVISLKNAINQAKGKSE